jgi:hypothetical protein
MSLGTHLVHSPALSPIDGWPNRTSEPNLGRHVESLCHGLPRKLGQESTLGQVLIQQQLPRESKNGTIWGSLWTTMLYTAQLDWAWRESDILTQHRRRGWSDSTRIQENLKAAKSRQETYANKRRRPLEFEVGDHVYLRVPPMKDVKRFGVKGKWAPRYIRPFSILDKCGTVAYKVDLPPSLARVHDIFHVSQLNKCLKAPVHIVLPEVTPLEVDLPYPEHPIKVLDQNDRVTRRKTIKFFNIQ